MKAYLFDTETTGLVSNRSLKLDKQPHLIEYYGCTANLKTGRVLSEYDQLVKPPRPDLVTPKITKITGIRYKDLESAPPVASVIDKMISELESADLIIGQNLSFDKDMMEIEAERLGKVIKWPKKMVCTIEQTMHLCGYRLSLTALYEHLFGETFKGAHRAKHDVMALLRCARELHKRGMI